MSGGEHKPVSVQPPWFSWVVLEGLAKEYRTDFRAAKRQTQVAGGASVDGIHREAASFIGGTFKGINRKNHKQC